MKKYSSIMKANYLHTSHKKRKIWFFILVSILFFGLVFPWLISKISDLVIYPFHVTTAWVKNSDDSIPVYLRSRASLISELEDMRSKMSVETGTQLSIKRLLEENMQLRALVDIGTTSERLVARVIARPGSLAYDLMQIDRGFENGVKVGLPVYSGIDSVVGVVSEVSAKYSFIELFTTPGFESTAYIIGSNVFSTLEGMGGGVARVKLPQGVPIEVGQLVLLPGIASGVYGEIVSIENHPTQPEQYGYVTPPVSMNNIYYVSIDIDATEVKDEHEIEKNIKNNIQHKMLISDFALNSISNRLQTEIATTASSTLEEIEAVSETTSAINN